MVQDPNQLTYLPTAIKEFTQMKASYLDWCIGFFKEQDYKSQEEAKKVYNTYEIPFCEVRIPHDDIESTNDDDLGEW